MRLRPSILLAAAWTVSAQASPARAQETLDDLEKVQDAASEPTRAAVPSDGKTTPEVNGYTDNRFSFTGVNRSGLMPTQEVPVLQEFLEANVQLRVYLVPSKLTFMYADASLFYQSGWLFRSGGASRLTANSSHDIPALDPFFVPSELYLSASPRPWLNLLVGKKRITWGSGFAFNPTDLLSPAKDPTDPNFQRAGNWVARVELPFEKLTFTGLFAPEALYTQAGIPYAMFRYPSYPASDGTGTRDNASHYLAAARLYALLFDADLNLMYFFSNHYQDAFANKSRLGLSFSRYFFTDYELHVETLLSLGSARSLPCAAGCAAGPSFAQTKLESKTFYPRLIAGTRRQFSDESMLSLEYYFQGDGYSDHQFADAVQLISTSVTSAAASGQGGALPERFAFDPLRRHYLIASYNKPRIFDDWTVGAVLIAGLRDLSGLFTPSVSWSAKEWLTLSLYGYFPIRGLGVGEVAIGNRRVSEYSLTPFDHRVLFEARAFY